MKEIDFKCYSLSVPVSILLMMPVTYIELGQKDAESCNPTLFDVSRVHCVNIKSHIENLIGQQKYPQHFSKSNLALVKV